jgi:hypothetical protein
MAEVCCARWHRLVPEGFRSIHKGFDASVIGGLDWSGLVDDHLFLREEVVVSHKEVCVGLVCAVTAELATAGATTMQQLAWWLQHGRDLRRSRACACLQD